MDRAAVRGGEGDSEVIGVNEGGGDGLHHGGEGLSGQRSSQGFLLGLGL